MKRILEHEWFLGACLALLIAFAYTPSLSAPFLFDDVGAVVNNPTIRRLTSLDVLRPPSDGSTTTSRPVVNLSFAFNYALSGERVWSYHAVNLAIHTLAALAVMGIVRRVLARISGERSPVLPWLCAVGWALHPLQTESVVCIAQRTESLCGLFYLFTLYGFLRGTSSRPDTASELHPRRVSQRWLGASVVACLLGMGTKEVMVTAPLLVLLADRTFVAGRFSTALRQRGRYYAALASTWVLLAILAAQSGGARGTSAGFGLGITAWTYLLRQCDAIVLYLKLALWPYPLALDYGTAVANSIGEVWWQGIVVLTLIGIVIWALVHRPQLGFAGAWVFLILAPSSSFVPLVTQTIAEHRMYLPLAGVVTCGGILLRDGVGRRLFWLVAASAIALTLLTRARVRVYRDPLTIWSDSVAHYPSSARAHNNLALVLQQEGRAAHANAHFGRAVELQPGYVWGHYNWGVALLAQGRFDEAAQQIDRARQLAPGIEQDPRLAETQFELGRLADRVGRPADAAARYGETLRLAPGHVEAHAKLGLLLARANRLEAAAEQFEAVIRLQPDNADAHANLGNVLLLLARPRDALASYERALRLRPNDARLRESLEAARQAVR